MAGRSEVAEEILCANILKKGVCTGLTVFIAIFSSVLRIFCCPELRLKLFRAVGRLQYITIPGYPIYRLAGPGAHISPAVTFSIFRPLAFCVITHICESEVIPELVRKKKYFKSNSFKY